MKIITQICFALSAAVFAAGHLSAQTLKWEYLPPYEVKTYNGDKRGGLAVCELHPGDKSVVVWIGSNGKPQVTNEFSVAAGDNGRCDIVRLTPSELAIRFRTQLSPDAPVVNVLRRFKKTKQEITVSEKILHPNEEIPLALPQMSDPFGFFTTGYYLTEDRRQYFAIRRYSN